MDKALIENWNSRVAKDDIVIFLGDFCYKSRLSPKNYIDQLNGQITFVEGNHDANNSLNVKIQYLVINAAGQDIFCVHDPQDFNTAYRINLVAHVHGHWKVRKIYNTFLINVGVDVWKFSPVNINEILAAKNSYEKRWNKKWEKKYGKRYKSKFLKIGNQY